MVANQSNTESCPACGSTALDEWGDVSSKVCSNCSAVIDSDSVTSYTEDIDTNDGQAGEASSDAWDDDISITDASEAILIEILNRSETLSSELGLSNETELRVGELLTSAWESNFMHGRSQETTVAASIYLATRESSRTIPPGCIAEVAAIQKTDLISTYKSLRRELGCSLKPAEPADYVSFICDKLGVAEEIELNALNRLSGRETLPGNPIGSAAAGVYLSAQEKDDRVSMRELAELVGITKETVWNHTCNIES